MDKTNIYLDLSKCSEGQRNKAISLLPKINNILSYKYMPNSGFIYLHYDRNEGWFVDEQYGIRIKQEVTYDEFLGLFGEKKTPQELADQIIKIMQDTGLEYDAMLEVIKLTREALANDH